MQTWLYKNWWVLGINGFIAILFGVVAWRVPVETIMHFVDVFGYIILASGVILIIVSFSNMNKKRSTVLWLLEGIFNTAVGVIIVFNSTGSLDLFLVFFGIWALLLGVVQAIMGFMLKGHQSGKELLIFNALLCIALGVILFYNPLAEKNFLKIITGIIALLAGILLIYISFRLKASSKKQLAAQNDEQVGGEETQMEEVKD